MPRYVVGWSTGTLSDRLLDADGRTRIFATVSEANRAARHDFERMAALSAVHMTADERISADGRLSIVERGAGDHAYAVFVDEYEEPS